MSTLPPTVSLLLSLLATTPALAKSTPETWDTVAARHLELTAENAGQVHEVHIGPGRVTTFVFNVKLLPGGVVLEEHGLFRAVMVEEATGIVMLLPSGALPAGAQPLLTVRFADGALPASATFRLVSPVSSSPGW